MTRRDLFKRISSYESRPRNNCNFLVARKAILILSRPFVGARRLLRFNRPYFKPELRYETVLEEQREQERASTVHARMFASCRFELTLRAKRDLKHFLKLNFNTSYCFCRFHWTVRKNRNVSDSENIPLCIWRDWNRIIRYHTADVYSNSYYYEFCNKQKFVSSIKCYKQCDAFFGFFIQILLYIVCFVFLMKNEILHSDTY